MLIYVHIPKCAGSTMFVFMKKQYKLLQIKSWHGFKWNSVGKHVECLFGHFPYGIHQNLNSAFHKYDYFTFLRDPVNRVISLYYFIQKREDNKAQSEFLEKSLDELILSNTRAAFDNDMVRFIAGRDDIGMYPPASKVTRDDLEKAKENLRLFKGIGFVETFDKSFKQFGAALHWNTTTYEKTLVREHPSKQELEPKTLSLIEERTQLDLELYNYAKSL